MSLKHDPKFYEALNAFVALVNARYELYWELCGYTFGKSPVVVIYPKGNKYLKLVRCDRDNDGNVLESGRSVFGFVNTENGDVLKPASWAAPAKHARGNILAPDGGAGALTPEGAHPCVNYLKGG